MGTLAKSEYPDEMLHNAAFHQGFDCLLRPDRSSEKEIKSVFEITACDSLIYTIDHPHLTVSNFMESSIGLKRVKTKKNCDLRHLY